MEKRLGKIKSVSFGFGGYQEAQFGLSVDLGGDGWGVTDFISGGWSESITIGPHTQWTEQDRTNNRAEMVKRIDQLLREANCSSVDQLRGKPVEITFDGNILKYWRILTEVL
jgi:hypothetical protein